MNDTIDCCIVGAGPAGLVAALYLRRFHRSVRVFDSGASRARLIPRTHNYPGFPHGITGDELLERLRQQLGQVGGAIVPAEVRAIERDDAGFVVHTGETTQHARTVLLATGVVDAEPPLRGVADVRRAGLLRQCPICDGFEATGQRLAVIGAGVHGVREALFLRHYTRELCFIALGGEADLAPALRDELRTHGVTCLIGPAQAVACAPDGGVQITLHDGATHRYDRFYVALGTTPRAELGRALGARTDERGNFVVDAHCRTSVDGLYAAGDIVSALDQIVVALGHAAIVATTIHNQLRKTG